MNSYRRLLASAVFLAYVGWLSPVAAGPSEDFALRISQRVLDSSYATIASLDKHKGSSNDIMIRDREWIKKFAAVLRSGKYQPELSIFAVGPPLSFFEGDGKQLVSFQMLPGPTLRVDSEDFEVDQKTFSGLIDLLKAKRK